MNIASSQTGGILNIGNGSTRTGDIIIGNTANTGAIRIETNSTKSTDSDPAISIGTTAVTKLIKIGS